MLTTTPLRVSEAIAQLCQALCPGEEPVFVPVQPDRNADKNECFGNAARKAKKDGGAAQYGWCIFEWPRVMIEAIFHAVWRSPSGQMLDVTPGDGATDYILFLSDRMRKYDDVTVDSVRKPLSDDPLVKRFIEVSEQIAKIVSRPGEKFTRLTSLSPDEIVPLAAEHERLQSLLAQEHMIAPNDPCPCGRHRKYRDCCGIKEWS